MLCCKLKHQNIKTTHGTLLKLHQPISMNLYIICGIPKQENTPSRLFTATSRGDKIVKP